MTRVLLVLLLVAIALSAPQDVRSPERLVREGGAVTAEFAEVSITHAPENLRCVSLGTDRSTCSAQLVVENRGAAELRIPQEPFSARGLEASFLPLPNPVIVPGGGSAALPLLFTAPAAASGAVYDLVLRTSAGGFLVPEPSFVDSDCDSGSLATTCVLDHVFLVEDNDVIAGNNLRIGPLGSIENTTSPQGPVNVTINLSGWLNITAGGNISLVGADCATNSCAAEGGGSLTVNATAVNVSGYVNVSGGNGNGAQTMLGGQGGTLNITAPIVVLNATVRADGGSITGGGTGSGGNASSVLVSAGELVIAGALNATGGTGDGAACNPNRGHRGSGANVTLRANVTLNGSVSAHAGLIGLCNDGSGGWVNITGSSHALGGAINASGPTGAAGFGNVSVSYAAGLNLVAAQLNPSLFVERANSSGALDFVTNRSNYTGSLLTSFSSLVNTSNRTLLYNTTAFNASARLRFSGHGFAAATAVPLNNGVACEAPQCTNVSTGDPFIIDVTGFFAAPQNFSLAGPFNAHPQAENAQQNASRIAVADFVNLSAFWTDDAGLGSAQLETNESGVWQNKSGVYDPAVPVSGAAAWANFTWRNASVGREPVAADVIVGWRIWASDATGLWNATNVSAFHVLVPELNASLAAPSPIGTVNVPRLQQFLVNGSVVCQREHCGDVNGTLFYNATTARPDAVVSTDNGGSPFVIQDNESRNATQPCPGNPLDLGEWCNVTFDVNATGSIGTRWELGVKFNSTQVGVPENFTSDNATALITPCAESLTVGFDNLSFSQQLPSTAGNPAVNNADGIYRVSVDSGGCDLNLWVKATDLENATFARAILGGNVSFNNASDSYASAYRMNNQSFSGANGTLEQGVLAGADSVFYCYLDVPPVPAGRYDATLSICGNATGTATVC